MDSIDTIRRERTLKMRVEDFLLRQVRGTGVLSSVFSELAENTESSFLFGGMVRDILSR